MEKYRIKEYNKNSKELILESSTGKLMYMNEGVFKDTFVKVKDMAISLIHKGKMILTKLGDRIVDLVTPVQTMANDMPGVYVELSEDMEELANENGIEVKNTLQEKLKEMDDEDASDESMAKLCSMFLVNLLSSLKLKDKKILEAKSVPYADDDLPGNIDRKNSPLFPETQHDVDGEIVRSETPGRNLTGRKTPQAQKEGNEVFVAMQQKRSWIPDVPDKSRSEIVELLDNQIKRVFSREITGVSAKKFNEALYTPYFIFGAPGIGKTSMIEQMIEKYSGSDVTKGSLVSKIFLKGNEITSYSISSPMVTNDIKVNRDEYGNPIKSEDGEGFSFKDLNTKIIGTGASSNIPAFKYIEYVDNGTENSKNAERYNIEMDKSLGYGIIFIDEYSRMDDPQLVQTINGLVQSRVVGDRYLGTHWVIIVASNFPMFDYSKTIDSQKALWEATISKTQGDIIKQVYGGAPEKARFKMINFLPTYEEWIEWAKTKKLDDSEIALLTDENGDLKREMGLNPLITDYLGSSLFSFWWYNTWDKKPYETKVGSADLSEPRYWHHLSFYLDELDNKYGISSYVNVKDAKAYIEEVLEILGMSGLEYATTDMADFLNDELLTLSSNDLSNVWVSPEKITYKPEKGETRLKNINYLPSSRPYVGQPRKLAQKVYAKKPFTITKDNVDHIIYNELGHNLDKVATFVGNFFGTGRFKNLRNDVNNTNYQIPEFVGGLSRAMDFVYELCELIIKDIKNAYNGRPINPDVIFGSSMGVFRYDKDVTELKSYGDEYRSFLFSVLYNMMEKFFQNK